MEGDEYDFLDSMLERICPIFEESDAIEPDSSLAQGICIYMYSCSHDRPIDDAGIWLIVVPSCCCGQSQRVRGSQDKVDRSIRKQKTVQSSSHPISMT